MAGQMVPDGGVDWFKIQYGRGRIGDDVKRLISRRHEKIETNNDRVSRFLYTRIENPKRQLASVVLDLDRQSRPEFADGHSLFLPKSRKLQNSWNLVG
jgi:hypothetical protein